MTCNDCKYLRQGPGSMLCGHEPEPKGRENYVHAGFDACEYFVDLHWDELTDQQRIALGFKKEGDFWRSPDSKYGGFVSLPESKNHLK